MTYFKSTLRRVVPRTLLDAYQGFKRQQAAARNQAESTEKIFTDIYFHNRWGGEPGTFFSGLGSRDTFIVSPYVEKVTSELRRLGAETMTGVDLGCGDFTVGRQLAHLCRRYIGVDIVAPLIAYNQATFGDGGASFLHANIVEEALPSGDICFVRQVLQHLSNAQIAAVLPKLNQFTWCFVTEHHPSPQWMRRANEDKPHGDDIRVRSGSGVYLDLPPFDIPSARYQLLLEVPGSITVDGSDPGVIRTYLLAGDPSQAGCQRVEHQPVPTAPPRPTVS